MLLLVWANPGHLEPLTLNQRVQGSSPCAPTNVFNPLADFGSAIPTSSRALIPTNRLVLFLMQAAQQSALHGEPSQSHLLRACKIPMPKEWLDFACRV